MRKFNAENERLKRQYYHFLREAKRFDHKTVDKVAHAIARFEESTGYKPFKTFHFEQAVSFKKKLAATKNLKTYKPLSQATRSSTLRPLKAFFQWLASQKGYRSKLSYSDAEYFNLSASDERVAHAHREKPSPTMRQLQHAFDQMPSRTILERRDRAVFALLVLTGGRDGAIASLKLKHVDLIEAVIHFDAREVKTKAAKTFDTWFFPVDDAYRACFEAWVGELRDVQLFGRDDPLFPKTRVEPVNGVFKPVGLSRDSWASADPIRKLIKQAFEQAGLPTFGPHSFRRTLVLEAEQRCQTPEQFKAWSQNLGHEHVATTFNSYGNIAPRRQAEVIRGFGK